MVAAPFSLLEATLVCLCSAFVRRSEAAWVCLCSACDGGFFGRVTCFLAGCGQVRDVLLGGLRAGP